MGAAVATELRLYTSEELAEVKDCAVVNEAGPVNNKKRRSDMTHTAACFNKLFFYTD